MNTTSIPSRPDGGQKHRAARLQEDPVLAGHIAAGEARLRAAVVAECLAFGDPQAEAESRANAKPIAPHVAAAIGAAEAAGTPAGHAMALAAVVLRKVVHIDSRRSADKAYSRLIDRCSFADLTGRRDLIANLIALRNAVEEIDLCQVGWYREFLVGVGLDPSLEDEDGNAISIGAQITKGIDLPPHRDLPHGPAADPGVFDNNVIPNMRRLTGGMIMDVRWEAVAQGADEVVAAVDDVKVAVTEEDPATLAETLGRLPEWIEDHTYAIDDIDDKFDRLREISARLLIAQMFWEIVVKARADGWSAGRVLSILERFHETIGAERAPDPVIKHEPAETPSGQEECTEAPKKPKTAVEAQQEMILPYLMKNFYEATMTRPTVDRKFIVRPYIPAGTVGIVAGPGGVGKSLLAMDLGMKVAMMSVAPKPAKKGNLNFDALCPLGGTIDPEAAGTVLFVTGEDDEDDLKRRGLSLDPDGEYKIAPFYTLPLIGMDIDTEIVGKARFELVTREFLPRLQEAIQLLNHRHPDNPVRLLILDPAGDLIGGDENDAEIAKFLMRTLRKLARLYGLTILLLAHVGKGDPEEAAKRGMRGSSALQAGARFVFVLWPASEERAKSIRKQISATSGDIVFGKLIKSNHPEATHNTITFIRRPDGRLVDVTMSARGAGPNNSPAALAAAVAAAAEMGSPFSHYDENGVYARRDELPEPFNKMGRDRLERLVGEAVELSLLAKTGKGGRGGTVMLVRPGGEDNMQADDRGDA